jgi:hypothetical protein
LQTALTTAISGNEIWVKAGRYKPTTGTDRSATFQPIDGVAVYGGFAGTETAREQRNPAANLTTLSGDIGTPGDNSDNSYHVVTGATGVTLDGFTIKAGNANSAYPNDSGGGMYNRDSSPTLTNVTFSGNSANAGGGMYNYSGSLTLTNVTFSGNSAAWKGGGMFNYSSSPTLTNVTFNGNSAIDWGGGMYNYWNSSPTLTNVTFSGNSANLVGGGMGNYYSNPTLTNVTFSGNSAQRGGGMRNDSSNPTLTNVTFSGNSAQWGGGIGNSFSSSPQIRNTIFWGNTASENGAQIYNDCSTPVVSDSVVQGGCPVGSTCTNIITTDPMLGALGNYGGFTQTIPLLVGSSAINTGNDATCAATDQRGVIRPQGAHCDIGAFEVLSDTKVFTIFLPLILH